MDLNLADYEAALLLRKLNGIIDRDRYSGMGSVSARGWLLNR